MDDIFYEQLIKKVPNSKDLMKKIAVVVLGLIVVFLALMFIPTFSIIIVLLVGFLVYYAFSFFNIEFEYILTNGELDIDCIYNKARRKRVFSININEFETMCTHDNKEQIGNFSNIEMTKDFSSGIIKDNTYFCLCRYNNKNIKLIIEPNETILNGISRYLTPRKLFKRK